MYNTDVKVFFLINLLSAKGKSKKKYIKYRGVEMVCRVKPVKVKFTENE